MKLQEKMSGRFGLRSPTMKVYRMIIIAIWTLSIGLSLTWNIYNQRKAILSLAHAKADLSLQKDVLYRKWVTQKGGVYVPISTTPPNPYLKVGRRDVITTEGQHLTLVNPAYMTRQVRDIAKAKGFEFTSITSLKPLRPENAPDRWEKDALVKFEKGVKEVVGIHTVSGKEYFRIIRPFIVENGCLKCHAVQGYKTGEIRGGISSAISMEHLYSIERSIQMQHFLAHALIWLMGVFGIAFVSKRLNLQVGHIRNAEQKAVMEHEKAESYLNIAAEIILNIDMDGTILLLNETGYKLLGYENGTLIGKNWCDTCIPESSRSFALEHFESLKNGEIDQSSFVFPVITKDETERMISWQATIYRDDAGNMLGTLVAGQDVTDRRRDEESLRASEVRYRRLFEAARDGILILNVETGMIDDVNPFMITLLGFSREQFIGKTIWDVGLFKDIIPNRDKFLELQKSGYVRYEDLPLQTADGSIIEVEFVSNIYEAGNKKVIQCNIRDITEHKRAELLRKTQIAELQRWHNVTMGREGRIIELKREVNELLDANGRPLRYPGVVPQNGKGM